MAYTQTDLDNIKRAIASGALRARVGDEDIQFRSLDEMFRIRDAIAEEVTGTARTHIKTISTQSGWR